MRGALEGGRRRRDERGNKQKDFAVRYHERERERDRTPRLLLARSLVVFFLPPFVVPGAALLPVVRIKSIYKFKNFNGL
jgi:hypothetical protein